MKLRLENLGRIQKAEIDVRPLTVFIGKNGTNKTWAAYALYGLVRQLAWNSRAEVEPASPAFEKRLAEFADVVIERILKDRGETSVDREYLRGYTGPRLDLSLQPTTLAKLLNVQQRDVDRCVATLVPEDFDSPESATRLDLKFDGEAQLDRSAYVLADDAEVGVAHYFTGKKNGAARNDVAEAMRVLTLPNIGTARLLPAERKLLSGKFTGRLGKILAALSPVLEDFATPFMERDYAVASDLDLARLLTPLLGGRLDYRDGEAPKFMPTGTELKLDLESSASIVGSLAGLDLYLRQDAQPGDFLIIDEPEMNAHPEAILGIAEVLAILANAGVNVVVTTHSPYFVDHLENLMDAAALPKKKQALAKERMQLKDERAFLPADKLSVYLFEERDDRVEVTPALNRRERGIDWRTFSEVSDRVHNLRGELMELKERRKP